MKEFAKAILLEQEDMLTCSVCEAQLAEYVDTQLMGIEPGRGFAEVELHLQVCPHCARAYRELMALVTLAYTEKVPHPARKPKFDLSFLETEPKKPFWWDELGRLITDIPILIGRTAASFGQLPPPLTRKLVPVGAYRKKKLIPAPEEGEEFVELLELPRLEANLVIKVCLGTVFNGKGTLVLEVGTIAPPQPIAQAKVTLRDQDGNLLEGMPTDEDGLAFFRELDIGKYVIQVEHGGQTSIFSVILAPVSQTLSK